MFEKIYFIFLIFKQLTFPYPQIKQFSLKLPLNRNFLCAKLFSRGVNMHIKSKIYKKTLYIILCGELDENSAAYTRDRLDEIFSAHNFNQVIIDLSELEFMDSTGIGVMIGRYNKMKERKIPIFICYPSKHAEKIFKMTGLYQIMPKIV